MADEHEHAAEPEPEHAAEPEPEHEPEHEHDHGHDHEHHEHVHELSYPDAVAQFREDKDDYFKNGDHSPIPAADRAAFTGLPYFPVDEAYYFEGVPLLPYTGSEPSRFQIPTSDGKLRPAHRGGTLGFELGGVPYSLTAYVLDEGDPTSLFVPFLDATSGTETYGAGRYMDLEPEEDGTYILDFNVAYHPSCVYDVIFSCPITPPENRLPIRVEAGEKLAPGHD